MALLPLDTWRQLMGFHPWHFWGLADSSDLAITKSCNDLVKAYPWQNVDAASRSEIVTAIETAEARLTEWLGYAPAPRYTSFTVPWPGASADLGRWWNVQLPDGYIQAAGVETLTAISAGAAVTYTDADGDGYKEKFTVSAATTVTDVKEIAAYFAAADRYDGADFTDDVGDHWRIQPVSVQISGGTVTITGPSWLLVKPVTYEGVTNVGSGLAPVTTSTTPAHFATTLDIYRRWTNTNGTTAATSQGVIIWETRPSAACCGCIDCDPPADAFSGSPYDPAAVAQGIARVGLRDAERGIVALGESSYDSTTGVWSSFNWSVCQTPDRAIIRVLAGYPLDSNGQMARRWQTVVARFAAAELDRPICACAEVNKSIYRWSFDLARSSGANDEAYSAVSADDLNNPFGTRRGHVFAFREVERMKQLRGFLA